MKLPRWFDLDRGFDFLFALRDRLAVAARRALAFGPPAPRARRRSSHRSTVDLAVERLETRWLMSVTVTLDPTAYTCRESDGTAPLISVSLSAAPTATVTVDYATSDGTAVNGVNYTGTSGTLYFYPSAGSPSDQYQAFNFAALDDGVFDTDKTVNVTLSNVTGPATLGTATGAVTITNTDPAPSISFAASPVSVSEEAGSVTLTAVLSAAAGCDLPFAYYTLDDTAVSGQDYTGVSGNFTFRAGQTRYDIPIALLDSDNTDGTKSFGLDVTGTGADPAMAYAEVDIAGDAPPAVAFSSSGYSTQENAGTAAITVSLSAASDEAVTVDYASSDDTAVAGTDYTRVSGTLTFTPGQTSQTFDVPILDENVVEDDEALNLTLSGPGGATLGSPSSATLTIANDGLNDEPPDAKVANDPVQGFWLPVGRDFFSPATGAVMAPQALDPNDCGCTPPAGDLSAGPAAPAEGTVGWGFGVGPALVYRSDTVSAQPILQVSVTPDPAAGVPADLQATLTWDGSVQPTVTFLTTGHSAGDTYGLALQVGSPVTATGYYPYRVDVQIDYSGGPSLTRSVTGYTPVVANDAAPFGAGWSVAGADRLLNVTGGVLWVYGSGGTRFFADDGSGGYTSPPNDTGALVPNGDGTYTYTAADQVTWSFDGGGALTQVSDPHGLALAYGYSGGLLQSVTGPNGRAVTFSYSGGLLSAVQEPGGRTVTATVDGSNRLTGLQLPDGSLRTFSYDTNQRLTGDAYGADALAFAYGAAGGLHTATLATGATYAVTPANEVCLATGPALNASAAVGMVVDPNGQATAYAADGLGRLTQVQAPIGTDRRTLNTAGQVLVETDPRGFLTTYAYNGSGDLLSVAYPGGGVTQYQSYTAFHKPGVVIDGDGNRTTFTYDATTGDLRTVREAAGGVTTYAYYQAGATPTAWCRR